MFTKMFLVLAMLFTANVFALGTVSVSRATRAIENGQAVRVITATITADAAAATVPNTAIARVHGCLMKVITNPGATAPTDNYDIELLDGDDATVDAAKALLMNRDTANTEVVYPQSEAGSSGGLYFQPGTYTLSVSNNAVNSAVIVLKMFFKDCP